MRTLSVLAGPAALKQIREKGLAAGDIGAVFGASGAAKWLTIYGLDRALYSEFFAAATGPVSLFGTSIGAFKLAAAAQADPAAALERLAGAYVKQRYRGEVTPAVISGETRRIIATMLGAGGATDVLANPRFRYHCGAIRCRGLLSKDGARAQKLAMTKAFALAAIGRRHLRRMVHRAVFSDPRALGTLTAADGYPSEFFSLTTDNLPQALLASGSIPLLMQGVRELPDESGAGVYRDGGLFDYHPVPSNLSDRFDGLVLYPHFYSYLIEGWFDKFFAKRRVTADRLSNVVVLAPTADYVASLPGGKIPDRQDFYTYAGRDEERQRAWRTVIERGHELGAEFLDLVRSERIRDEVRPL